MGTSSEITISLINYGPSGIPDSTRICIVLKHLMYRIDKSKNITHNKQKKEKDRRVYEIPKWITYIPVEEGIEFQ